jgi:DNA repair ATPase RecN
MWEIVMQAAVSLGAGGIGAKVIQVFAQRRNVKAQASKTGADTTAILTDTALKAATAAIANIEQQAEKLGAQLEKTQGELELTRDKLQAVLRHMRVLDGLLRERGVTVPEFVYPPHRNGAA